MTIYSVKRFPTSLIRAKNSFLKKAIIALTSLMLLTSVGANAADRNFAKAEKELKIMSKIFETSLAEQHNQKNPLVGSKKPKATYLAKQGMVFSFNFGRNSFSGDNEWEVFGEGISNLVGEIALEVGSALNEVGRVPPPSHAPDVEFYLEDNMDAFEERMEALESMREQQQQQREQVREIQREIRKIERESNRLNGDKSKSDKLKSELQSKIEVLNQRMDEYKKSMAEYRKKKNEKYTQSAQLKSDIIVSTLCDYGATLRSLDDEEYITLIFSNYRDGNDQIYVFGAQQVRSCSTKEKLLKSAISYQL